MSEHTTKDVEAPIYVDRMGDFAISENDDTYKKYCRMIRSYYRMAWENHTCWHCDEPILSGDMYMGYVYVARPHVFIRLLGKTVGLWTEKSHYPECPRDMDFFEQEMQEEWERHNSFNEETERKAA